MVAEPGPDMRIRALTSGSTVLNRKPSHRRMRIVGLAS
jgi:hypothetical protein